VDLLDLVCLLTVYSRLLELVSRCDRSPSRGFGLADYNARIMQPAVDIVSAAGHSRSLLVDHSISNVDVQSGTFCEHSAG
jgi:hypothetical protein